MELRGFMVGGIPGEGGYHRGGGIAEEGGITGEGGIAGGGGIPGERGYCRGGGTSQGHIAREAQKVEIFFSCLFPRVF